MPLVIVCIRVCKQYFVTGNISTHIGRCTRTMHCTVDTWYKTFRSMTPFDGILLSMFVLHVLVNINVNARGQKLLL